MKLDKPVKAQVLSVTGFAAALATGAARTMLMLHGAR
jgi:hypothetical protein